MRAQAGVMRRDEQPSQACVDSGFNLSLVMRRLPARARHVVCRDFRVLSSDFAAVPDSDSGSLLEIPGG